MTVSARRIGWIGAGSRAAAGVVLVYLAVLGGDLSWNLDWRDVALGLAVFPGVMLDVGLAAGRFAAGRCATRARSRSRSIAP